MAAGAACRMLTDRDIAVRFVTVVTPDDPPERTIRRMRYNAIWRLPPGRVQCAIRRRREPDDGDALQVPLPDMRNRDRIVQQRHARRDARRRWNTCRGAHPLRRGRDPRVPSSTASEQSCALNLFAHGSWV